MWPGPTGGDGQLHSCHAELTPRLAGVEGAPGRVSFLGALSVATHGQQQDWAGPGMPRGPSTLLLWGPQCGCLILGLPESEAQGGMSSETLGRKWDGKARRGQGGALWSGG